MKANNPKRKIFDAVDTLTEESSAQVQDQVADGVQMLPLDKIKAFHDHPFHLYDDERLQDMVESIKEHGVLSPMIIQKIKGGYEMLSGHNLMGKLFLAQASIVGSEFANSFTEFFLNHLSVPPINHYRCKRNIKQRIISNNPFF